MEAVAAILLVVALVGAAAAWRRRLVYRSFDPSRLARHRIGWSLVLIFTIRFATAATPARDQSKLADPKLQVVAAPVSAPSFPFDAYARAHAEDRVLAARQYVEGVGRRMWLLSNGITRAGRLLQAPAILDPDWRALLHAEIAGWAVAHQVAAREAPPPGFEEVHENYVRALSRMDDAGMDLRLGIERLDLRRVDRAIDQAAAASEEIEAVMSHMGAILDRDYARR